MVNAMSAIRYFMAISLWLALIAYGANRPITFLLNGKSFPGDVAPPYVPLPTVAPADQSELERYPNTNDVLGYISMGHTVTCHIVNDDYLQCSNGMEINVQTQTVQQVFQILGETHILLHTPQLSPVTQGTENVLPQIHDSKQQLEFKNDSWKSENSERRRSD